MPMTDPAAAIRFEVSQLIQLQIDTLSEPKSLTPPLLSEYHRRAERLRQLYGEIDQATTRKVIAEFGLRCDSGKSEKLAHIARNRWNCCSGSSPSKESARGVESMQ